MIDPAEFVDVLVSGGVELAVGVPDSLLKEFNSHLESGSSDMRNIVVANEGNALAMAAGHYLASGRPALVYLQNSGLGNVVNPLTSLMMPNVYGIPAVLLVGWRGRPDTSDAPQHELMGSITVEMLDLLGVDSQVLTEGGWEEAVTRAIRDSLDHQRPTALVVPKGTFASAGNSIASVNGLSRGEALETILDSLPEESVYVATTGYTSRELHAVRTRAQSNQPDFLNVGAMGHASSIALGIALTTPDKHVVCLDGDGAVAMHMGALATIGQQAPNRFGHVVLDNGVHDSVGGQPTSIAGADIAGIATSAGYREAWTVDSRDSLERCLDAAKSARGPWLIHVRIAPGVGEAEDRPGQFPQRMKDLRASLDA